MPQIRHLLLVFIFITSHFYTRGQSQCDLIKNFSVAVCDRDTAKAIADLEKFRQLFPTDPWIVEIDLFLSDLYRGKNELTKAKQIASSKKRLASQFKVDVIIFCR